MGKDVTPVKKVKNLRRKGGRRKKEKKDDDAEERVSVAVSCSSGSSLMNSGGRTRRQSCRRKRRRGVFRVAAAAVRISEPGSGASVANLLSICWQLESRGHQGGNK